MMKKIHTIAALILLAYVALLMSNVPPLVRSDHVSVNWNVLRISVLGFLIATAYLIGTAILKKRINLSGIHLTILVVETVVLAGLSTACLHKALTFFVARQETSLPSIVVEPGVGIPGLVELGMNVDQVRRRVRRAHVEYYPKIRYPWQIEDYNYEEPHFFQARASDTRKPGEKPTDVQVDIPAFGLVFYTKSDSDPIRSITFWSNPKPILINSNTWFTGKLSCGLSFADRRRVPRHEVIQHFGEPERHIVDDSTTSEQVREAIAAEQALLKQGQSFSFSKKHGNGVEHLQYPTNGIMFILQDDKVLAFTIKERVEQGGGHVR
jgi:hypothetical protein